MVLDTYDDETGMWIFKNTYDQDGQPKKVQIPLYDTEALEELYFVHIRVEDMNNLPDQEQRAARKKAEIEKRKKMKY